MKVPFRLRRSRETRPATALLLPGHDSTALLAVCVHRAVDPLPDIFTLHDGFLLRFKQALHEPVAGTMRLAELADNVLLPVDADLIPGLLDDEAQALGRERGLVFLPEGRVLAFTPRQPAALQELVGLNDGVIRRPWQSLHQPSGLASRLVSITLDMPDLPPEAIIEAGGAGIGIDVPGADSDGGQRGRSGREGGKGRGLRKALAWLRQALRGKKKNDVGPGETQPRPAGTPMAKKLAGHTGMGLGRALARLGQAIGSSKLANLGGKLMAASMNIFPRLTEKVFGKQEAALRRLLRYFRDGDIEKALRHAIPLNDNEPGAVAGGADLPSHATNYSLANIFSRTGPTDLWMSHDELFREIEREYRRQAEAATKRGDYRRAAFIYGKLLRDYRMAAVVLGQGGLHHDAAIIYLSRLNDRLAAAREFEAGGEMDRALELYRENGEHERAGDLLRRIGEEEQAIAEYRLAADKLMRTRSPCHAGDLMLKKAQRPDLARGYFQAGWELRPYGSAVACANRLAGLHADAGDHDALLGLVGEAETLFADAGNDSAAGEFFNHLAQLATQPNLEEIREELRDRALLGLANKLRQRGPTAAQLVPALFAAGTVWETAVVSDAQFAVKAPARRSAAPTSARPVPGAIITNLGEPSTLGAVCQASQTGELFLGFENGALIRYDCERGEVHYIDGQPGSVLGLAVNDDGSMLVVHCSDGIRDFLACYCRRGHYKLAYRRSLGAAAQRRLSPVVHGWTTLLWDSVRGVCVKLNGPRLLPEAEVPFDGDPGVVYLGPRHDRLSLSILVFDGREMSYFAKQRDRPDYRVLCPFPARNTEHPLGYPPLSWRQRKAIFEVAGIGPGGTLGWMGLDFRETGAPKCTMVLSAPGPYHAAALWPSGAMAAVSKDSVALLWTSPHGIREKWRKKVDMPTPVACFTYEPTHEVIVVGADGALVRIGTTW